MPWTRDILWIPSYLAWGFCLLESGLAADFLPAHGTELGMQFQLLTDTNYPVVFYLYFTVFIARSELLWKKFSRVCSSMFDIRGKHDFVSSASVLLILQWQNLKENLPEAKTFTLGDLESLHRFVKLPTNGRVKLVGQNSHLILSLENSSGMRFEKVKLGHITRNIRVS